MRWLLIFLLSGFSALAQNNPVPIGSWREHLPYGSAIDVTASPNFTYTATPYSLFRVALATGEVERMSRMSGLSETGVKTIRFDVNTGKLFIAYTNSNIDIIDAKGLHNLPGLKRENIQGDKMIYHFSPDGPNCYLSTGIGVVVVNTDRYEIKDSWLIGNNGGYVKVNMFTRDDQFFYAATEEGLKRTSRTNPLPNDFTTWQTILPGASKGVVHLNNQVIALRNDSLLKWTGSSWDVFFHNGKPITQINLTENKLTISQSMFSSASQVTVLNANGSIDRIIQQPNVIEAPSNAIVHQGQVWVADAYHGLSQWSSQLLNQYELNSPEGIATGEMVVYNDRLYAAAGSVNEAWNYQFNVNGIYKYAEDEWTNYNRFTINGIDSLFDFITLAIDPRDESVWAGSFGGGLWQLKQDRTFRIYKQNSPLGPTIGDPGSYRVSGLAFDAENNLWIANFGAAQYLHVLKADGSWQTFTSPFPLFENAVSQIVVDDANQKWIVAPKGNGLLVFDHGQSINDLSDDRWRLFQSGSGRGNLPSSDVLSIAKDKNGYIWVGTSDGIGVIQCAHEAFNTTCEAVLPIAVQGGFGNYLFKGEEVRSIAVDGADRKWVATKNGVWLVSADGEKVIEHFTENNSPLLSNDVKRIAINGSNGEIFFATANGICSFKGMATEGSEKNETLLVYPNPVPPGYGGSIAIKGLAANSFVRITELNGRLVYQTKALGGQATWNGLDYKGRRIASGVYLVLVRNEDGTERTTGKIVFIAK